MPESYWSDISAAPDTDVGCCHPYAAPMRPCQRAAGESEWSGAYEHTTLSETSKATPFIPGFD